MEIQTLESTTTQEITAVFNHAFSDYLIPFQLSEDQLQSKMQADKTDLSLSVGVFEHGKLIAFILHGYDVIDGYSVVYNGGTGVIPERRGSGLTRQMYRYLVPLLRGKDIHKIVLEVIRENYPAIASYEKSGFVTKRELACFKGKATVPYANTHLEIKILNEYPWNRMESFWDISPTWQNSKSAITASRGSCIALGAYLENQLVGYVILNTGSNRIHQLAVDKNFRRQGIASTLIARLVEQYDNSLAIINVDKTALGMDSFLNRIGLAKNLEQLEMECLLS